MRTDTEQLDWLTLTHAQAQRRKGAQGLLADLPRARSTDPETSHEAAERVRSSGTLRKQQQTVLAALIRWPGSTAVELAKSAGLDRYAVSRRLPELVPAHAKRGKPRVCTIAGTPQTTWYPR